MEYVVLFLFTVASMPAALCALAAGYLLFLASRALMRIDK